MKHILFLQSKKICYFKYRFQSCLEIIESFLFHVVNTFFNSDEESKYYLLSFSIYSFILNNSVNVKLFNNYNNYIYIDKWHELMVFDFLYNFILINSNIKDIGDYKITVFDGNEMSTSDEDQKIIGLFDEILQKISINDSDELKINQIKCVCSFLSKISTKYSYNLSITVLKLLIKIYQLNIKSCIILLERDISELTYYLLQFDQFISFLFEIMKYLEEYSNLYIELLNVLKKIEWSPSLNQLNYLLTNIPNTRYENIVYELLLHIDWEMCGGNQESNMIYNNKIIEHICLSNNLYSQQLIRKLSILSFEPYEPMQILDKSDCKLIQYSLFNHYKQLSINNNEISFANICTYLLLCTDYIYKFNWEPIIQIIHLNDIDMFMFTIDPLFRSIFFNINNKRKDSEKYSIELLKNNNMTLLTFLIRYNFINEAKIQSVIHAYQNDYKNKRTVNDIYNRLYHLTIDAIESHQYALLTCPNLLKAIIEMKPRSESILYWCKMTDYILNNVTDINHLGYWMEMIRMVNFILII